MNPDKLFKPVLIIAIAVSLFLLKALSALLIPFAIALLLFFMSTGFLRVIQKLNISKLILIPGISLSLFSLIFTFGLILFSSTKEFIVLAPSYASRFSTLFEQLLQRIFPLHDKQSLLEQIDWSMLIKPVSNLLSSSFSSFALFFGNLLLIVIILTFMLAGRNSFMNRLGSAYSKGQADTISQFLRSIENKISLFLLIKTIISAATAILCSVVMLIAGLDLAIFFGFLIFILNFIPNLGSIVASLCPIMMAFLQFGFSMTFVLLSLSIMVIQFVVGNVIEPRITGIGLNISPLVIIFSLLLWGWLWGIMGMMLAAPMTSVLQIIFSHFEKTRPLATLISARAPAPDTPPITQ